MRIAALASLALMAFASPALAQAAFPSPQSIATPAQPDAVQLHARRGRSPAEQWEQLPNTRIVRNVVTPTLTPFLPTPETATGAAVIVAPGGAFMMLSMDSEGYEVARWLADRGIAAFVLKYRLRQTSRDPAAFASEISALLAGGADRAARTDAPSAPPSAPSAPASAVEDGQAAVRMVRERAVEWGIDPRRIGMVGFSAGAMTALATALSEDSTVRPDFVAPIYGPMAAFDVPAYAPPMFAAIAADDPLFGGGFDMVGSWRAAGRPVEFHLYERGGHGFGMQQQGTTSDKWIEAFYAWIEARGLLRGEAAAR